MPLKPCETPACKSLVEHPKKYCRGCIRERHRKQDREYFHRSKAPHRQTTHPCTNEVGGYIALLREIDRAIKTA
jgi:hypothetical protein